MICDCGQPGPKMDYSRGINLTPKEMEGCLLGKSRLFASAIRSIQKLELARMADRFDEWAVESIIDDPGTTSEGPVAVSLCVGYPEGDRTTLLIREG